MSTDIHSRLRELFDYCHETGVLRWRYSIGSRAKAGAIAGTRAVQGHLVVRVDGALMLAHQIAWIVVKGSKPEGLFKHLDGDKTNNRIENLVITTKKSLNAHKKSVVVDASNVHDIFEYADGKLLWRSSLTGKNRVKGNSAGYINKDGYIVVESAGKAIGAHRLVWLMHNGIWPVGEIDHMNGVRHDNRIENLRDVSHKTNTENRRKAVSGSMTGSLGVTIFKGGRYRARIKSDGKLVSLGIFDTAESAHAAYIDAKRVLHQGCTL